MTNWIHTIVTASHVSLFDRFSRNCMENGLRCIAFSGDQHSKSGLFDTEGFRDTMADKLKMVLGILSAMDDGELFVYSDCDVQFFGRVHNDLENIANIQPKADLWFQHDGNGEFCAGFFMARNTNFARSILKESLEIINNYRDDQPAINYVLNKGRFDGKSGFELLPERYWTYGAKYGLWKNQTDFEVPNDIIMHHANWCVGIDTKHVILDLVKNKVDELRNRK